MALLKLITIFVAENRENLYKIFNFDFYQHVFLQIAMYKEQIMN